MGCNCDSYISCKDINVEKSVTSDSSEFSHTVDNTTTATNLPVSYVHKTKRMFSVSYSVSKATGSGGHIVACENTSLACGGSAGTTTHTAHCKEFCEIENITPYYLDRAKEIFVYKHATETLQWDIVSDKTALFKEKFGNKLYHKICIPKSVMTKGTEKFILVRKGIETVLASAEYAYAPFPNNDIPGGVWNLDGGVNTYGNNAPDTIDVAQILIFPLVGKQSIPLDKDVLHYGFYDYNAIEGGFIESSLSKDDGGKDYFYPYWCRSMPKDVTWRSIADKRYAHIYNLKLPVKSVDNWSPPSVETHALPFGSFAVNSVDEFVYSCLLTFSDIAGGSGVIVNHSSFGDLYKAIYEGNKIQPGMYNVFYPVVPV